MPKEFLITEDGSHTIYVPELDEHYHSVHGAVQESVHVYIESGFQMIQKQKINVLEIGFGTGLNAYLTYCYAQEKNQEINYCAIEKYPLGENEYKMLNYPESVFPEYASIFTRLHASDWNKPQSISARFILHKIQADFTEFQFDGQSQFDLIYYDAFAPQKQPEMWTEEILRKVAGQLKTGGILTTYCAKGAVRRALADAGLKMERIPGPIGKKEILRGKKAF